MLIIVLFKSPFMASDLSPLPQSCLTLGKANWLAGEGPIELVRGMSILARFRPERIVAHTVQWYMYIIVHCTACVLLSQNNEYCIVL